MGVMGVRRCPFQLLGFTLKAAYDYLLSEPEKFG